jgi:hypothetical protein
MTESKGWDNFLKINYFLRPKAIIFATVRQRDTQLNTHYR